MPTQSRGHGTLALLVTVVSGGRGLARVPCPRLCVGMRAQPPLGNSPFSSGAMPTALRGHGRTMPLPQQPLLIGCHAHGFAWACGPNPPCATAPSHRAAMPTALRGHGGTRPGQQQPLRNTGLTPSRLAFPTSPRKSELVFPAVLSEWGRAIAPSEPRALTRPRSPVDGFWLIPLSFSRGSQNRASADIRVNRRRQSTARHPHPGVGRSVSTARGCRG